MVCSLMLFGFMKKNGQWSGIEGNPPRLNEECQVPQSSILSRTPACLSAMKPSDLSESPFWNAG